MSKTDWTWKEIGIFFENFQFLSSIQTDDAKFRSNPSKNQHSACIHYSHSSFNSSKNKRAIFSNILERLHFLFECEHVGISRTEESRFRGTRTLILPPSLPQSSILPAPSRVRRLLGQALRLHPQRDRRLPNAYIMPTTAIVTSLLKYTHESSLRLCVYAHPTKISASWFRVKQDAKTARIA